MKGKISITVGDRVKVHTYTSAFDGWSVNSHLIELPSQLFIIDAQLTLDYAREVMKYAKTLVKPVTRLYVTHHHPDHLLGAAAMPLPIIALPGVAARITATGNFFAAALHAKMGERIPQSAPVAQRDMQPESETVDAVRLEFIPLRHAETEEALVIGIPEEGILITQDMIYNNIHAYLGELSFESWMAQIRVYAGMGQYRRILPGHGDPGGPELYGRMLNYLSQACTAYESSTHFEAFAAALRTRAPEFVNDALLLLSERSMFPKK